MEEKKIQLTLTKARGGTPSMNARRVFALVALGLALMALHIPQAAAQTIDQDFYYKLSTQFRGIGRKLDVFNGGPKNNLTRLEPDQLATCANVSGQLWTLTKTSKRASVTIDHGTNLNPVSR